MMVVFFGSFYLINLMLAVVAMAYEQEADAEAKVWPNHVTFLLHLALYFFVSQ